MGLGSGFRVPGSKFRVSGFGIRAWDSGFRISDSSTSARADHAEAAFGIRISGIRVRVRVPEFAGTRFRISGFGLGYQFVNGSCPRSPRGSSQRGTKSPFSGLGFVLALAGIRRFVVQIKAIEKQDLRTSTGANHACSHLPKEIEKT